MVLFSPTQKKCNEFITALAHAATKSTWEGPKNSVYMVHKIMQQEIALGTENVEDFFIVIFVVY